MGGYSQTFASPLAVTLVVEIRSPPRRKDEIRALEGQNQRKYWDRCSWFVPRLPTSQASVKMKGATACPGLCWSLDSEVELHLAVARARLGPRADNFSDSLTLTAMFPSVTGVCCNLQGRKMNFTNSKTLVGQCRDPPSSASPLTCPNIKNFFFQEK